LLFFFQAEDGIRDATVTGVQTCALPILTSRQRDERLWRPTKLFPITLVLVANPIHQREAGVPIVRAFSLSQSWKLRHQRAVCVRSEERRVGKECRWRLARRQRRDERKTR